MENQSGRVAYRTLTLDEDFVFSIMARSQKRCPSLLCLCRQAGVSANFVKKGGRCHVKSLITHSATPQSVARFYGFQIVKTIILFRSDTTWCAHVA
jgi:hypothetical protein